MKKWLRRVALATAGLMVACLFAIWIFVVQSDRKMNRHVEIAPHPIPLVEDAASIERGRYLFQSRGCTDCHGRDGHGVDVVNDGKGLRIAAPNISPGPGNVVKDYRAEDWDRIVRHGVKPNGKPAIGMSSDDFNRMTDADLTALVAYVRSMPPAAGGPAVMQLTSPLRVAYTLGLVKDAAEKIDHTLPVSAPVAEAVSVEHGAYVAQMCVSCHGAHYSGGKIPGAPPDWPAAANLTPGAGSAMARYPNLEQFAALFKTGRRPDGTAVSTVMPFASLREWNETDVAALYAFLRGLPPRQAGTY